MTPTPAAPRRLAVGLLAALLALGAGSLAAGRRPAVDPTPPRAGLPDRSDAGDWTGTWYYQNRDLKFVLWLETGEAGPRLRAQYLNLSSAESFRTDWDGRAAYDFRGRTGDVWIEITEADADTIKGNWSWFLGGRTTRREAGRFTIYRCADGRQLTLAFEGLERVHVDGNGVEHRVDFSQQFWMMRKGSRRHVLWAELPF